METEITVQVFGNLKDITDKIIKQGFVIDDIFTLKDYYFTGVEKDNVKSVSYAKILASSILVREVVCDGKTKGFLCYKNKVLDINGNVLTEEKIKTRVEGIEETLKILESAGLYCWCKLINDSIVFKKEEMSFCIQSVDELGLFIEYEEKKKHEGLTETEKFEALKQEVKELGLNLGEDFSCKKPFMKLHSK